MQILNINNLNTAELEDILDFCNKRISQDKGAFLIPMNPIKLMSSRKFSDFQNIVDTADMVFTDGRGLKWAASFLYKRIIPIAPGYKVMFSLIEQAVYTDRSIYILGTVNGILKVAIARLKKKYPELKLVGSHHGYFSESDEKRIFQNVANSKPDYVFVAMGEYKQEKIIDKLRKIYPSAIYLGVGGSVDLLAKVQPSPPEWIREHHMEWLFRLIRQPFRLPRFRALPIFILLVVIEKIKILIN